MYLVLLLLCKTTDSICTQWWICLVSRVAITNNFRREKPAVLHNYVALAMGRRDFFLIPHDDYLIQWKMSSDILFISANVTQTCKEGDSAIRPYYLNCFVANA